jgi:hypothetical protein
MVRFTAFIYVNDSLIVCGSPLMPFSRLLCYSTLMPIDTACRSLLRLRGEMTVNHVKANIWSLLSFPPLFVVEFCLNH